MTNKAKALVAAGVATVSVAVAPLTGLALNGGTAAVPVACGSTSGGGGCS